MAFELIPSLSVSASGLECERARMDIAANNLANANSTRSDDGTGPYQRRELVFSAIFNDTMGGAAATDGLGGVRIAALVKADTPPNFVYAPFHPDANKNGMVAMPNIQPVREMTDMISASRAYETNLAMIRNSKAMAEKILRLGRG